MPEHDVITSDDGMLYVKRSPLLYGYTINGINDSKRKNIKVKWFVTENVFHWHLCDTVVNTTLHSRWEIHL